jgi:hypothetical protein
MSLAVMLTLPLYCCDGREDVVREVGLPIMPQKGMIVRLPSQPNADRVDYMIEEVIVQDGSPLISARVRPENLSELQKWADKKKETVRAERLREGWR